MVSKLKAPAALQHTFGHIDCQVCNEANSLLYLSIAPELPFPEAFRLWISHRTLQRPPGALGSFSDARYLSRRTLRDYKACAGALGKFFGRLKLSAIHPGHIHEYQQGRAVCDQASGAWTRPCGANRIRKEIALLIRVLKAAHLWGEQQALYFEPMRAVESDVRRAMQPDEQRRFLAVAGSRVEWELILWYSILALETTASTNELRALRLGDVMLEQGILQIRREGAKNKYRIRTIPLESPEVAWALRRLIERARSLGATGPHQYLFPFRKTTNHFDPDRPMSDSGLKMRFNAVRDAANLPWLRPYDLRHTAITRLAEAGTPIQVIMSMAGHVTLRMQQHYITIAMVAKRKWVRSAWVEADPQTQPGHKPDAREYAVA